MLRVCLLLCCLTLTQCYYNLSGYTIFDITDMLWKNIDVNMDNKTDQEEMTKYFVGKYDTSPMNGYTSSNEFIEHWSQTYNDSYQACNHIFTKFDADYNHVVTGDDIGIIIRAVDLDQDGIFVQEDILMFLHWVYSSMNTPIFP